MELIKIKTELVTKKEFFKSSKRINTFAKKPLKGGIPLNEKNVIITLNACQKFCSNKFLNACKGIEIKISC